MTDEPVVASPRARIALLTLQLHALLDEVAVAEAAAPDWDLEAAQVQLRARLEHLIVERRRGLDEALQSARADAAEAIGAAHREVESRAASEVPPVSGYTLAALGVNPERGDATPITVHLDTDALVAAIAAVLEARAPVAVVRAAPLAPRNAPARPKKSFWAGALHTDVLLSIIGMIVVVIVLIAWST